MRIGGIFVILCGLAACAPFPDLDDTVEEAARAQPFPALTRIDGVLDAAASGPAGDQAQINAEMAARVAALRARAARLRRADI